MPASISFKRSLKLLYFLLIVISYGCSSLGDRKQSDAENVEWISPESIEKGPFRRDSLSTTQLESVDFLYETFKEVDPTSKEDWINDFRRDLLPDTEIEIWTMMANAFNSFCEGKELTIDLKKEAYKVVLLRSSIGEEEVLANLELVHLSEKEAREIMANYKLE